MLGHVRNDSPVRLEPGEEIIEVKGHRHLIWWDRYGFYGIFYGVKEAAPPMHEAQTITRHPRVTARRYLQRFYRAEERRDEWRKDGGDDAV